ncbi:MAG: FIST C-terminal domain-containing protein [Pseudomonadota bacterium]
MKAATGLAQGRQPDAALAARAVELAMDRADLRHPTAVLLYLTSEFATDPQPAISAAARAAGCLQVAGCTAAGVFTEEDWVLDAPAAAALVLGGGCGLHPTHGTAGETLTFAAPNALDMHWLTTGNPRFGGVSGDATGQGPYSVWSGARVQSAGRTEMRINGAHLRIGISQGVRLLSKPAPIETVSGHDLHTLGGEPALTTLVRELPLSSRAPARIPTHLLMAGLPFGELEGALEEGRYHLLPVVGVNPDDKSVTVAGSLTPGQSLFWALRHPQAAEQDMEAMLHRLQGRAPDEAGEPDFALMFPCIGRGPWFYGGQDRDIQALKRHFPGLPLLGFYGNGEIAHLDGANRLLQYSTVLVLGQGMEAADV